MSDAHDHDEIGVGSVHREIDPATVGANVSVFVQVTLERQTETLLEVFEIC